MPLASIDVDTQRRPTPAETALTRRVDLTTLRLFVAVCDEQNLTRAAQREGIAASAVSDERFRTGVRCRAIPLRDDWGRRELNIVVRDAAHLSATGRLMLDYLRAVETDRRGRAGGQLG